MTILVWVWHVTERGTKLILRSPRWGELDLVFDDVYVLGTGDR